MFSFYAFAISTALATLAGFFQENWDSYKSEAEAAWEHLDSISTTLSFQSNSTEKNTDMKEIRSSTSFSQSPNRFFWQADNFHPTRGETHKVAVATPNYGIALFRKSVDEKWDLIRYGPDRSVVDVNVTAAILGSRCPPLNPIDKIRFDEYAAAVGVKIESLEEHISAGGKRIRLTLKFPEEPVDLLGGKFSAKKIVFEFDPAHSWIVTAEDIVMDGYERHGTAKYDFDESGRPLLKNVVVHDSWEKTGQESLSETIYDRYEYKSDDRPFLPETYGLPALASGGRYNLRIIVFGASSGVLFFLFILLRKRSASVQNGPPR